MLEQKLRVVRPVECLWLVYFIIQPPDATLNSATCWLKFPAAQLHRDNTATLIKRDDSGTAMKSMDNIVEDYVRHLLGACVDVNKATFVLHGNISFI